MMYGKARWTYPLVVLAGWVGIASATPLGGDVTYQGRLMLLGAPVDDTADFQFTLWDADRDGNMVGSTVAVSDVPVVEGLFTVELDFGPSAFNGDARWLEIAVRSPHDPGDTEPFTTLTPRQAITAAPYALRTRGIAHDESTGHVGIGTTAPDLRLQVNGGTDAEPPGGGFIQAGPSNLHNLVIDTNEIMARQNGAVSSLFLNQDGGNVLISGVGDGNLGIGTNSPTERIQVAGLSTADDSYISLKSAGGNQFRTGIKFRVFNEDLGFTLENDERSGSNGLNVLRHVNDPDGVSALFINKQSGSIGIGTTAPVTTFHVSRGDGVENISRIITLGGARFGGQFDYGAIDFRNYDNDSGQVDYTGARISSRNNGDSDDGDLRFFTANDQTLTERMVIQPDGNVGIGTSSPGFPLTFPNTLGDKISLYGQSGNHYGFGIQGALLQIHTNVEAADIAFGYGQSASFTEVMRIRGNGNVGIGTTAPIAGLQVSGGPEFNQVRFDSMDPGGTWLQLLNEDTGGTGWSLASTGSENTEGAGSLLFYDWLAGPRVLFDPNGNVGIGTTAPDVRLHVTGGTDAEPADGGFIQAGPSDLHNLVIDTNEIMARQNGATSSLFLNQDGGNVLISNAGSGRVGIGTASPEAYLHVAPSTSADADEILQAISPADADFVSTDVAIMQAGPASFDGTVLSVQSRRGNSNAYNLFHVRNNLIGTPESKFVIQGDGKVGIGRTPTTNTLEVEGVASKSAAGDWLANSDARIKTDVTTIEGADALAKLDRVRLVEFRYTDAYRNAHPSIADRRYINVIAQEFAEVFPDHVKSSGEKLPAGGRSDGGAAGRDPNRDEILQVDPYPLTIYSAAAVQELHALVKQQAARITALEARLDSLGSADRTSAASAGASSAATTAALAGGAVLLLALGLTARLHRGRRAMTLLLAAGALTVAASATVARADDFEIDWFTIDGGGITFAAGGDFDMSGTLGQSDAGPAALTGGDFELVGGFWPVATGADVCAQPGDLNLDGDIDGDDVQLFVNCLLGAGGPNCICADLDGGGVGVSDVELFVSLLIGN